jgi:hypothetical protein
MLPAALPWDRRAQQIGVQRQHSWDKLGRLKKGVFLAHLRIFRPHGPRVGRRPPDCRGPPTHYLRKIYVDSVVFTPHQIAGLAFGADHVLVGTDYPFDMAEADPLAHLASVPAFPDSTLAAIAGGNAQRLLGI